MTHPAASAHHFTLRYLEGTDLRDRKHVHTVVRASSWLEAELARLELPEEIADRLEVVERGEPETGAPLANGREHQPAKKAAQRKRGLR